MSARLVPPIRDLFSEHPGAARCSPERVGALLWVLCYVPEGEGPPEAVEVAAALEVLDIERGEAA